MIFLHWDKYFETGFEPMDKQHMEYIGVLEKLQDSVYSQNNEFFKVQSANFIKHLENHFATENELMKEVDYPGFFSHKAEHDRFLDKNIKSIANLNTKSTNEINLFFEIAYRWFKNHLEINDRKLAKYLKDKN